MRHRCVLIAIVVSFVTAAVTQQLTPPSQAELDAISRRGRMLAEYDQAAWHATDAVMALRPDLSELSFYAAKKTSNGWSAAWGRLNEQRDRALLFYEAIQGDSPTDFRALVHESPIEDTGFFLVAGHAIPLALGDYPREQRAYNMAVIPAELEGVYVYIQPAQTKTGVYPLGGDVRYHISADGTKILEKRQLHKTILEMETTKDTVTDFHIHVLSNVPEDTDVFHVLRKNPPVPGYVSTKTFSYLIASDGSIRVIGETDKWLGRQKKR